MSHLRTTPDWRAGPADLTTRAVAGFLDVVPRWARALGFATPTWSRA